MALVSMRRGGWVMSVLLAAGFAASVSSVLAQSGGTNTGSSDPSALQGPKVEDRNTPGVEGLFGAGSNEKKKLANEQRIPPRVYQEAIRSISGEDAPADVRLSDAQSTKIKGYMDEHREAMRAFMDANRGKMGDVRKGGRGKGGPEGGKPGAADDQKAAAREIMKNAPKMEDVWTKVWAELTPAQKTAVDKELNEFRARASDMREDQYVNKRLKRKGGPDGPAGKPGEPGAGGPFGKGRPGPDGGGPGGSPKMSPERHERLMRLLSRLTPEQQDEMLDRLEARVNQGGPRGGEGAPPPKRRQRNAPPPPDQPPMPRGEGDEMDAPPPPEHGD